MKKIVFAFFLFAVVTAQATNSPGVNEKILKAFKETFTDVKEVKWHEVDDVYYAYFLQDSITVRASYDNQGNLLNTLRYYFQKRLVPAIVSKIKKEYPGTTIFYVTELSTEEGVVYFVRLRNDNFWYTVMSDADGELTQTEKFKRADK